MKQATNKVSEDLPLFVQQTILKKKPSSLILSEVEGLV